MEDKVLGWRGGGLPSYRNSRCLLSSTETVAPVSIKQRVGLPFIHTSTVSSPGGRSLVELAAISVGWYILELG